MKFQRRYTYWLLVLLTLLISGCGRSIKPEERSAIQNVSVEQTVLVPENLIFIGSPSTISLIGSNFGAVGGLIAGLAESETNDPRVLKGQIKDYMLSEHIEIGQILRDEFIKQLLADRFFKDRYVAEAKTHFKLEIVDYGMVVKPWSDTQYKPVIKINAKLVEPTGQILFDKSVEISQLNDHTPSYTCREYVTKPGILKEAFEIASREAAKQLLEKFK